MNDFLRNGAQTIPTGRADMAVDTGLRSFMLGVYNKMALGLALSAALAWTVSSTPALLSLLVGPAGGLTMLGFGVVFAPVVLLLVSMFTMRNPSPTGANILYWSIVALIGTGLGLTLWRMAGIDGGMMTVAKAFLTTSVAFGALSLWGYTTKRDLSGFGVFLIMGLIGVIVASIVNMFVQSGPLGFIITVAGLLVFAGLTAFDTQRLKYSYYELQGNVRGMAVATTFGALSLYLNFVNMFQLLLSLMSSNNE
jgi:FtsH-binding integral membrane protein